MLPFITDTNRNKQQLQFQLRPLISACQRPTCCFSAETRVHKRGQPQFGHWDFFFFWRKNRPWFPGTMQLMRGSPRKIRLWHHGFLKHAAEPTLCPAIIKPQWISTVGWKGARRRFFCKQGFDFHHNWPSLIIVSHHLTLAVHDLLFVNVPCVGFGDTQWWEYKLHVGNINQRVCCLQWVKTCLKLNIYFCRAILFPQLWNISTDLGNPPK